MLDGFDVSPGSELWLDGGLHVLGGRLIVVVEVVTISELELVDIFVVDIARVDTRLGFAYRRHRRIGSFLWGQIAPEVLAA
jgi:hypothetical protein